MITWFKNRRMRPGRVWRRPLAGVVVGLAGLALAPAAYANGWSLQSVQTESSWVSSQLSGVSCVPATTDNCYAVGYSETSGSGITALIEHWNGTTWSVYSSGGPAGASDSTLNSVSCPTPTFCLAVGEYHVGGVGIPLAYSFGSSTGFVQQTVPLAGGASGYLSSVSCQSASLCEAAGTSGPISATSALVEGWNGSSFSQQQTGSSTGATVLSAVSCALAGSAFCMAVGSENLGGFVIVPYAESFNGSNWVTQTQASNDQFRVQPAGTNAVNLDGVHCIASTSCQVIGSYYGGSGDSVANPWGAALSGSSWTFELLPPSNADAGFAPGDALACPSECWAVGNYSTSTGLALFADTTNGSQWLFSSLPNPSGTEPTLFSVACGLIDYCKAVGGYKNSAGNFVAFAEQYVYTTTTKTGPKCTDFDCPPPNPATPRHFSLKASSLEKHGATITAELRKPKTLVLLVQGARHDQPVIVGLVPLGSHSAGSSKIHWNLRVNGQRLGKGTYEVSLHSVIGSILSPATPPKETSGWL